MAEIASTTFNQSDASNTGSLPGISGSSAPSQIDDSIRALIGAVKREHDWRNFTITTTGSANAYVVTYSVAPAAYYTGQRFGVITNFAVTGSATININSLGAKTIKKLVSGAKTNLASGDVSSGDYLDLLYDGTDMVWVNKGVASVSAASDTASGIVELATTTEQLTGTDATRASTPDSIAALWEQGADVASAGTVSLGEGGYFNITGTTTITDIDFATDKAGRKAWVKFAGALTLTHNASTLILPGGANITTAAGDTACFVSEGSDVVRCTSYNRASGLPVVSPTAGGMALIATFNPTTGNNVDLTSGILSTYRELVIEIEGLSGTLNGQFKLGISANAGSSFGTLVNISGSFPGGADAFSGYLRISGIQLSTLSTTFGVLLSGSTSNTTGGDIVLSSVMKAATSGPINAVRINFNSAGTIDAGTIRFYGVS